MKGERYSGSLQAAHFNPCLYLFNIFSTDLWFKFRLILRIFLRRQHTYPGVTWILLIGYVLHLKHCNMQCHPQMEKSCAKNLAVRRSPSSFLVCICGMFLRTHTPDYSMNRSVFVSTAVSIWGQAKTMNWPWGWNSSILLNVLLCCGQIP